MTSQRGFAAMSIGLMMATWGCTPAPTPADAGPDVSTLDAGSSDGGPGSVDAGPDAGLSCSDPTSCPNGLSCCNHFCASLNRNARDCNQTSCDGTHLCPHGLTCCGDLCSDLARDSTNCGACGAACASNQFCSGTACFAVAFENVCADPSVTVIADQGGDAPSDMQLGAALNAACSPASPFSVIAQSAGTGLLDPVSGAPQTAAGQMIATAGGPDVELLVHYLEAGASPVYYSADSVSGPLQSIAFIARDGGATLATTSAGSLTGSHDYFLVELVVDPSSGTLAFVCYGFSSTGTVAGAWYLSHLLLPATAGVSQAWRIVEWTAQDGGTGPATGDSFALVASGN